QRLADELDQRGFASAAVHGDLGQGARERALRAFRNHKVDVLVATDVAARGIDVEGVTHVVNMGCPEDEKSYLHRIGRTGRAGASGVAITFVDWDDLARWRMINQELGLPYPDPAETYSSSEHFFSDLGIPAGTKGRLPRDQRTRAGLDAEQVEDLGETGKSARRQDGSRSRDGSRNGQPRGRGRRSGRQAGERSGGGRPSSERTIGRAASDRSGDGARSADRSDGRQGGDARRDGEQRPRRRRN
ncbi:MAG: ATP-dependent helicase, partial [Pseudonocardiaceae bacterium]|nr:ATP-dependent helicase [Pseudonocardiaceae bacterium]